MLFNLPTLLNSVLVLTGLAGIAATLLTFARSRLPENDTELIETIDALLPQTQCAQCGYPGCRPYAQAIANGAPLDLCPPGGFATQKRLAETLGRDAGVQLAAPQTLIAVINERDCIGCGLCVPPCPVDAILGAPKYMHTVLTDHCTGCELCIEPCPVDCISLTAVPS